MEGKDGRTEKATARRRNKERKKGNMCVSPEVNSMAVLMLGVIALRISVPMMIAAFASFMASIFSFELLGTWNSTDIVDWISGWSVGLTVAMAPFIITIMSAAVIANMVQTKPYFSTQALKFKFSSLNPVKGLKNLFSTQSLVKLGISLLKIALIVSVAYILMHSKMLMFMGMSKYSFVSSLKWFSLEVYRLVITIISIFSAIALIDWCWRKYKYEKSLMMTKEEVKEERKQEETNPIIKKRVVKRMRELSLMRMMAAVPQANLVVTNPTHVAVALKYDPETMEAPQVVAKGLRLVAQRIKKIARENDVPIIEKPAVARALYKNVKVGQSIPSKFYEAVAELLAYLHRLGKGIKMGG